jgi:hypothetical protein
MKSNGNQNDGFANLCAILRIEARTGNCKFIKLVAIHERERKNPWFLVGVKYQSFQGFRFL